MTDETKRKLKAESMRKYRTLKRIYNIVKDVNATTLTLTFNEETLQNTNKQTRLQYIKRYLNDFASDYVLNVDYGALNSREHYHAIATPKYKIFLLNRYKYGNIQAVKIHSNKRYKNINKSDKEIATRFYNHATKQTTKGEKLIFARPNKNESKYKNQIDAFLNGIKQATNDEIINFLSEELNELDEWRKQYEQEQEEMRQTFIKNLSYKRLN